jgi:hypothetical protein
MKKKIFIPVVLVMLGTVIFISLKKESEIIKVKYEMLACEGCNHMKVIKASDPSLLSKTVIPQSSDIELIIDKALAQKNTEFCFQGKRPLINFNLNFIDPPGIKFYIERQIQLDECE